jgi:hypothetical protein
MGMKRKTRSPLDRKPLRNRGNRSRKSAEASWRTSSSQVASPAARILACSSHVWRVRGDKFVTVRRRMAALRVGLEGEKFVGQYPEDLRAEGCRVFNDLVGDGFNIDHVVVAPQGIFVIETKTHSKPLKGKTVVEFDGERILVNGFAPDRDPATQVRAASRWLSNCLSESTARRFPVKPVVIFPGWYVEGEPDEVKSDIWVLSHKRFFKYLEE